VQDVLSNSTLDCFYFGVAKWTEREAGFYPLVFAKLYKKMGLLSVPVSVLTYPGVNLEYKDNFRLPGAFSTTCKVLLFVRHKASERCGRLGFL
jgi:hypothetical protein